MDARAGSLWHKTAGEVIPRNSPRHGGGPLCYKDRWHTADIPLERLTGPAVKISIQARAEVDPDTMLTVKDIQEWEEEHGAIPDTAIVM